MDIISLLNPQIAQQAENKAINMAGLNALGQLLALSGPQARPVGTGQALGQALIGGYQGYEASRQKSIEELMTGIKLREALAGKSPELSKEQQQYSFQKYGTLNFRDLDKTQQADVLNFGQAPDVNKALEQYINSQKLYAETGIDLRNEALENLKKAQRLNQIQPSVGENKPQVNPPTVRNFKER